MSATAASSRRLTIVRAADISAPDPSGTPAWLVQHLWSSGAVGVIGGPPKSCKSWLALELAVAVASGRPCLGRFPVPVPGPVLLYAAEDTPHQVRQRIEQLCQARGASLDTLELDLILEPALRIDHPQDVERLRTTLAAHHYRLLILDPYVRLQAADENHVTEVAAILSTLRELSRTFSLALLLVHHARKSSGNAPGLALRGSSDFHAWGDSNLYLHRRGPDLVLTIEHRAAAALPPLTLALAVQPLHLEIRHNESTHGLSLQQRLLTALQNGPLRLDQLRAAVGARKQSVAHTLHAMEASGLITRGAHGWHLSTTSTRFPVPLPIEMGTGNHTPQPPRRPGPLPSHQLDLVE